MKNRHLTNKQLANRMANILKADTTDEFQIEEASATWNETLEHLSSLFSSMPRDRVALAFEKVFNVVSVLAEDEDETVTDEQIDNDGVGEEEEIPEDDKLLVEEDDEVVKKSNIKLSAALAMAIDHAKEQANFPKGYLPLDKIEVVEDEDEEEVASMHKRSSRM
jgi:hypothetical protein